MCSAWAPGTRRLYSPGEPFGPVARCNLRCEKISGMKSAILAKGSARPKPIGLKEVDGIAFVEVQPGAESLSGEELRAKLDAFYAKHPLRTLRKSQKGIVEHLREDRDRR